MLVPRGERRLRSQAQSGDDSVLTPRTAPNTEASACMDASFCPLRVAPWFVMFYMCSFMRSKCFMPFANAPPQMLEQRMLGIKDMTPLLSLFASTSVHVHVNVHANVHVHVHVRVHVAALVLIPSAALGLFLHWLWDVSTLCMCL